MSEFLTVLQGKFCYFTFHMRKDSESEVAQSCLTLCEPMGCSLPGSSVHGIFQAIVLEWIAISFSRGSSQPRDQTQVSCIVGGFFISWATRETITTLDHTPIIILIFKLKFLFLWFSSSFLLLATVFTQLQTPGAQLFDVIYFSFMGLPW